MNIVKGLKGRLIFLGLVPTFLFLLLTILYIVPSMERDIYAEKELQTKELVNVGMSVLKRFYDLEQSGSLTREEAQIQAQDVIKNMKFGELKEDYFWINDDQPMMIMHPFRPDLEGEILSEIKDPDGLYLFNEFVKVVKNSKAGYVPYKWQYYSDKDRIEPKLSYVSLFEPWGWIIGTGVYMNDVDSIVFNKMVTTVSTIIGIIIFTSIIIFLYSHRTIIKPVEYAVRVGEKMADGDFTEKVDQKLQGKEDEISRLLIVFNKININMKSVLSKVLSSSSEISIQSNELKVNIERTNQSLENTVATSQGLLDAAASQQVGAKESSKAIEEMAVGINHIADNSVSINDFSIDLIDKVSSGNRIVHNAITKMKEIKTVTEDTSSVIKNLNEDSKQIRSILALISGVADQTNLLALNAAIEAARVGDQGKGFAVVADEIRKLANNTADSVEKVAKIINDISEKTEVAVSRTVKSVVSVDEGIENVQKVEEMFAEVLIAQEEISKQIAEMTAITEQMSAGTEELTATVTNFSHTAELTSGNAQNILEVSQHQLDDMNRVLQFAKELDEMSDSLKSLVDQFKVHSK